MRRPSLCLLLFVIAMGSTAVAHANSWTPRVQGKRVQAHERFAAAGRYLPSIIDKAFFLEVARAIDAETRQHDFSRQNELHLRAGDVHNGLSYELLLRNTAAAGPITLVAERRHGPSGALQLLKIWQEESFPPGLMPQREWKQLKLERDLPAFGELAKPLSDLAR